MNGTMQRKYWLDTMLQITGPVLEALAAGKLKERLPLVAESARNRFAPLEAFGRTACGIAPWLELEGLEGEEEALRQQYLQLMHKAIAAAVSPDSPDYMDFETKSQPLVDAAFLSHALLRAPKQIAGKLDAKVKVDLIAALKKTRTIPPFMNNWLLFSAMVEAALKLLGEPDYDLMRVSYAIEKFEDWYVGDGTYGDGKHYHWDYYNSFVIQPMLVDIMHMFEEDSSRNAQLKPLIMERAKRHAAVLERFISPEGTYPVIGRSVLYRFGAFQLLSQAALQHFICESLKPSQVRCALTAVIRRIMDAPGNFDDNGWLRLGVYGYQPATAEEYINTGSLYLCSAVFLPLGLPPQDEFWSGANERWTAQRFLAGENLSADHAIMI